MRLWIIFWLLVSATVTAFAAANWPVLTAQTIINLGWAEVSAPLGLIMLGALVSVAVLFLLFVVWLETRVLIQLRPVGFAVGQRGDATESMSALVTRLERLEETMSRELEQTNRRLAAQVDRLGQGLEHAS